MSIPSNSNNSNNSNNNKERHPQRKRRWYYSQPSVNNDPHVTPNKKTKHSTTPSVPRDTRDLRQELLKEYEKERIENEQQVSKMEQQLHEFFHKTKTPYSYIDDKGIYNFTPTPTPETKEKTAADSSSSTTGTDSTANTKTDNTTAANPFMNMTFNPFVPSNPASFFSNASAVPTLWTTIFPIKITPASQSVSKEPVAGVSVAQKSASVAAPQVLIEIREKIEHIDDLIALCDKYPLADDKKYNINMAAIHAIREPLCDLSKMVGMQTIKQTIVDQILYYLQELHIPEVKKNTEKSDKADTYSGKSTTTTEEPKLLNPFANPFAPSFLAPPWGVATASASASAAPASIFPMNIKKNQWSNTAAIGIDDFALPTKGDFMHTVIYGPPGSGKTEVAKIIGRIFSNLGILNKKIFKKVSRNDLVAGYLGQTAIKTKDMIKASLGGVLFIDEAYSLGNSEKRDSFAKECVDTLCEALSEHKHNWMVIIAGYEKELNDCFFSLNEGLNSRFTWRFKLDAYKPCELKAIYEKQVHDYGWTVVAPMDQVNTDDVLPESWFASKMDYFTTYGRDMETLFTKTKIAHSRRVFCLPMCEKKIITFADLENGFKLFIENPEVSERKEKNSGGPYMKTLYL